jgi:hypothetical protein
MLCSRCQVPDFLETANLAVFGPGFKVSDRQL